MAISLSFPVAWLLVLVSQWHGFSYAVVRDRHSEHDGSQGLCLCLILSYDI